MITGYDLFGELFPDVSIYAAQNQRAHQALDQIGQLAQPVIASPNGSARVVSQDMLNLNNTYKTTAAVPFNSWSDLYGSVSRQSDLLTRSQVQNLIATGELQNFTVTGTSTRSNFTTRPFDASKIILLTDGICGSTCTIFAELM